MIMKILICLSQTHLLYSTSTSPSLRICWPMPLLAMAVKALLLRTKSVWLLRLRSVNITVVPALLQRVVFLHLICRIEAHNYHKISTQKQWWMKAKVNVNLPENMHHSQLHLWTVREHQLQGAHHRSLTPMSHTHKPQLHQIHKTKITQWTNRPNFIRVYAQFAFCKPNNNYTEGKFWFLHESAEALEK